MKSERAAGLSVVAITGGDEDDGDPRVQGSGVIIHRRYLLTCWHVVQRHVSSAFDRRPVPMDVPWPRLRMVAGANSAQLEHLAHDGELDVALLHSPDQELAPVAEWLDDSSLHEWLRRGLAWTAVGYRPRTPPELDRHHGRALMGDNDATFQLWGGIPHGFSGGAVIPDGADLCAGLVRLGGPQSSTSMAIRSSKLAEFLARMPGPTPVSLRRVAWRPRLVTEAGAAEAPRRVFAVPHFRNTNFTGRRGALDALWCWGSARRSDDTCTSCGFVRRGPGKAWPRTTNPSSASL